MPRIKRWFPVNHNINRDPEVWVMRRSIGEKSLSVWLEFLSIADQNEGELPGDYEALIRSVSGTCQATVRTVTAVYQYAISQVWLASEPTLHVVKYWNYHKSREPQKPLLGSLPSGPSGPSGPKKKEDNTSHLAAVPPKWPHPDLLIKKYNEETPEQVPAVEKITPARVKKAREYLKLFPEETFWTEAFIEVGRSDFLLGRKNGTGHDSFKANFDWLLSKGKDGTENVVKVYEGRYRNGR